MYSFEYHRPDAASKAAGLCTGESRYLAGGQSLIQSMRLRLASAENLIDLSGIKELRGIKSDGKTVTIGAMTTHADVAASKDVQQAIPALAELAGGIGDMMVRSVGTIGGSLANADPAACYLAGVLGLNATVHTEKRTIGADQFFKGLYETALEPGELITAVSFPAPTKAAYVKYKQSASRFALVGVMVAQTGGSVRVAVTGAKSTAFRVPELEQALAADFSEKAAEKVSLKADGMNADLHATADYRAAMIVVMAKRAVAAANAR